MYNREEWLKGLKKGDKVADKKYYGEYTIFTIKNITPKGFIRLNEKENILLKPNGEYHKFENWRSFKLIIEPVTDKVLKEIEYNKENRLLMKEFNSLSDEIINNKYKLTNESLEKLIKVFKECELK